MPGGTTSSFAPIAVWNCSDVCRQRLPADVLILFTNQLPTVSLYRPYNIAPRLVVNGYSNYVFINLTSR